MGNEDLGFVPDAAPDHSALGFVPDAPAVSPMKQPSTWDKVKSVVGSTASIMSGEAPQNATENEKIAADYINNSLAGRIGAIGRYADAGNQMLAGQIAEKGAQAGMNPKLAAGLAMVPALPSKMLMPQGPISALFAASGLEGQKPPFQNLIPKPQVYGTPGNQYSVIGGDERILGGDMGPTPPQLIPQVPKQEAVGDTYKNPTVAQRGIAEVASTQSAVKPKYLAAVIANPEIMDDATPSMRQVGTEYERVFKELGIQFDSPTYQEITGTRYAPTNDAQISKYRGILENAANRLEAGVEISPGEAFLARSAGKKILDSVQGLARSQMAADVEKMDEYLMENGIPQIKQLSQQYFRAAAKEALSDILPRNKNMSPNAIRALLMAKYGTDAVTALGEGKPGAAVLKAATAGMMSPFVQGKAIPFLFGSPSPNVTGAVPMAGASLENFYQQQQRNPAPPLAPR